MNCKVFENNVIGLIEGTLSVDLKSDMDKHLLQCEKCNKLYQNVRATYNIRSSADNQKVTPYFYSHLEQRLNKNKENNLYSLRMLNVPWQSVAAGILILTGIYIGIYIGKNINIPDKSTTITNDNDVLNIYVTEYYIDKTRYESLEYLDSNN